MTIFSDFSRELATVGRCRASNVASALVCMLLLAPGCAVWSAQIGDALRVEVGLLTETGRLGGTGIEIAAPGLLIEIYERRDFELVWASPLRTDAAIDVIRASCDDGLNPADYNLARIEPTQQFLAEGRKLTNRERAAFDLLLTDSLIRLAVDLRFGKVAPPAVLTDSKFARDFDGLELTLAIEQLIDAESLSAGMAVFLPRSTQYLRLRAALQRFRLLEKQGGWPVLPEGPTVLPGARDSRLAVLARRLALSGDLDRGLGEVSQYDGVLQAAVRRFQSRHGLEPDAEIGPTTLSALNVVAARRVDQIRLNLERARWAFDESKDSYVLVNIPAFRADIVRDGQTSWSANVVVGEREEQTPVLRSELRYVVFNPTWAVPYSIATEELLPRIQSDSNFLERGGYEILDRAGSRVDPDTIDWSALTSDHFPYTLVQRPGSANQLGQIKFLFPNEYSVCIHDTPAKGLFAEAERAFSHGCVRLERPLDFAEQILGEQGWTRAAIDGEIQTARTRGVSLPKPLPVSLVYWTTEVDDFGVVHFYPDIYERDAALLAALDALVGG